MTYTVIGHHPQAGMIRLGERMNYDDAARTAWEAAVGDGFAASRSGIDRAEVMTESGKTVLVVYAQGKREAAA